MYRSIWSLVLIAFAAVLGGCAGHIKMLPDGGYAIMTTVGDTLDRSTSFVGEYDCPKDKEGKPILGQCTPKGPVAKERVHGQTVAGQAVTGAVAGTGAALINASAARSVAEKGQCKAGANCGTVIRNQVQSVANAENKNNSKVNVNVGGVGCLATGGTDCKP